MRGSDPPLCSVHRDQTTTVIVAPGGRRSAGFYDPTYSLEEVADLMVAMLDPGLDDELSAARVAVRRVMEQLEGEMSPAEYARLAEVIFKGANSIARLLKTRMDISAEALEGVTGWLGKVYDRIDQEIGEKKEERGPEERGSQGNKDGG